MVMEDLEQIIPDRLKQLSGRKIYLCLSGAIVFLIVVCLTLGALLGAHRHGYLGNSNVDTYMIDSLEQQLQKAGLCMSPSCMKTGSEMLEKMDSTVNPCENFFQYACGNWRASINLPPDHKQITVLSKLGDENEERLRETIESPIRRNELQSSERKMKEFFDMCLHDYGRIHEGGKEVIEVIRNGLGGWYALDPENWLEEWDVQSAIKYSFSDLDTDILFTVSQNYLYDAKKYGILVGPGGLGMYWRSYIEQDTDGVQDAYRDYMREVGVLLLRDANLTLDASQTDARIEQFVNDAYNTEKQLAQHMYSSFVAGRHYRMTFSTVGEMATNFSQVSWRLIMTSLFEGVDISSDTDIHIRSVTYFRLLQEMLRNETQSHELSRMMNNYIIWRVVDEYTAKLSWEYKASYYRFANARYGVTEFPPTWHLCLNTVRTKMGPVLAAEYLHTHVGDHNRVKVRSMFSNLLKSAEEAVDSWSWMDNTTRPLAKQKIKGITATIGFPSKYFNRTNLDTLYASLTIDKGLGFFRNLLNVNRFQRTMRGLEYESDTLDYMWEWVISHGGFGERAWMFWQNNHLLVPAGVLQHPFYEIDRPEAFNYGSLGSLIAIEILKSVGDMGHYVWVNGSYTDWWHVNTYAEFIKRKSCFNDYFVGMVLGPYLVNGENKTVTLTRAGSATFNTVRDLGGLRLAYQTYKKSIEVSGKDKMPVAMNLNADQAFFTSYAQTKCYIRRPEDAYRQARMSYIPPDVSLHGVLRHMKEFTAAFNCPVTSKLHALSNDTCEVY